MCPGLGKKIGRLIWPCSADDDAAARRLGWCCCWGAALRLAGRAAGPHACRAWLGGSRVAGGCGKPVHRCGGGKSPATEGALSEDPHSGQVVRAARLGGRRRPAAGIRGRSGYPTDHRTGRAPPAISSSWSSAGAPGMSRRSCTGGHRAARRHGLHRLSAAKSGARRPIFMPRPGHTVQAYSRLRYAQVTIKVDQFLGTPRR